MVLLLSVAALLSGCASPPEPIIEDNLDAFSEGMDALLETGMTLREARAVLKERMPPASLNSDGPVAGGTGSPRLRRVMIGWPTLNPGTTLVVTVFCDRNGKIVRWTCGRVIE